MISSAPYIKLSKVQIDKVGNSLIYFAQKLPRLSKTKALKLIYILDELAIKKAGIPFFNLTYKVWKFGPVSEELFIDLSSETTLLSAYIERSSEDGSICLSPVQKFYDDEFSDNELDLLDFTIERFGDKTAKELVSHMHRKNAPWYQTALENGVLKLLENEEINHTELVINMRRLIEHDDRKMEIYDDFLENN